MMKQNLQLKINQSLQLTPQLQASIRLLQLSTQELQEEISQALESNPFLESEEEDRREDGAQHAEATQKQNAEADTEASIRLGEAGSSAEVGAAEGMEFTWDAAGEFEAAGNLGEDRREVDDLAFATEAARSDEMEIHEAYWSEGGSGAARRQHSEDDDEYDPHARTAHQPSLREHLLTQLGELHLEAAERVLAAWVIEALDEEGYLRDPLDELWEALPGEWHERYELERKDLKSAWQIVRGMSPCGVGARDLRDCLLLQLDERNRPAAAASTARGTANKGVPKKVSQPVTLAEATAQQIVRDHFELLAARDFVQLRKLLRLDEETLTAARAVIQRLSPRPGAQFGSNPTRYVVADVLVRRQGEHWMARINPAVLPRLSVNQAYARILRKEKAAYSGELSNLLQEARWMVKNVQQRFDTIQRVAQAILERQGAFLEQGEVAMKPLVLRDIAEDLGLHESTISRVTTQKYMLTPRGIFEFKYFFGSHVETDSGGECSAIAIKALLKQLIQDERKPLSDNTLSTLLGKQGINVARRTIAKYREALRIPPAHLRKYEVHPGAQ